MSGRRFLGMVLAGFFLFATTSLQAEARKVVKKSSPQYPALAAKMRVEGTVKLEAEVDASGNVGEVRVVSGHALLKPAAVECVKKWQYEPAGEKTVEVVAFDFKLP
jgi:TonB family protein